MWERKPNNRPDLFELSKDGESIYSWERAHSPKPGIQDKNLFGNFVPVYASFSHAFVLDALEILGAKREEVILDPFSGGGTTLAAASQMGMPSIGLDLSPFSVALAKLRFSSSPDEITFSNILESRKENCIEINFSSETTSLFNADDLSLIASLIPRGEGPQKCVGLREMFGSTTLDLDNSSYVLLCSIIAANKSAKVATGSNPVWIRKLLDGEPSNDAQLEILTKTFGKMLRSLSLRGDGPVPQVQLADARSMPIETGSIDVAIFSPPYLNRLDYFVSNYPANMVLCDLMRYDAEKIRKEMIGTTKIKDKNASPYPIGDYCKNLLDTIWGHQSKASKTYYYWNYVDYIRSTYEVSAELRRVMRPGGRGAIVIQDSFYKDVRVLTHQIVLESMLEQGFRCNIARCETVKDHMGRMSPNQVKYTREKILYEYILEFSY